jgi:NAD(P)-dependent dehydrogenase (short-subunit alcohol dehydrogenase family)
MLLEKKNAVVYGAGGAIGRAIAHAFAREGARVFLTGRTLATVDTSGILRSCDRQRSPS